MSALRVLVALVVGLRRVGWAWAPARAMDKAGFTAWLGEEFGGTTLSENTKKALVAGFDEGVIKSSNVMDDAHVLDGNGMKDTIELWLAFYEDACKGAALPDRRSDRVLIKQWLIARFQKDESLDGRDVKVKPLTPEQKIDLANQGASELWELGYGELALALGRAPAREECEKYAYKAPWSSMTGGALAVKHKLTSLDDLLAKAESTHDLSPIDEHITTLSQALRADKGVAFAATLATAVLGWWQEARNQLKSPALIVKYAKHYRKLHVGRLLPVEVDRNIVSTTLAGAIAGAASSPSGGVKFVGLDRLDGLSSGTRTAAGSDTSSQVSSSIGPAASAVSSSDISRILASVEKTGQSVSTMSARVSSLADEVERIGTQLEIVDRRTTVKCFECGSTKHRVQDCPQKKAREAREAGAKEGDKKRE